MSFILQEKKKDCENKTIRFPNDLLRRINEAIEGKGVSFTSFIIQACEYALENLEEDSED